MKSFQPLLSPYKLVNLCVCLYVACLLMPAYRPIIVYSTSEVYYGWAALTLGPIGLFGGHYSWLANPLLWYSWAQYYRGRYTRAAFVAVLGLAVAVTFLFTKTIYEGSSGAYPFEVRFGYYVWLSSIAAMALASALAQRAR